MSADTDSLRLLDPQACLPCGNPSRPGLLHICAGCLPALREQDGFGDRFSYPRAAEEQATLRARIELHLGVSRYDKDLSTVNYTERFKSFMDALTAFLAWEGHADAHLHKFAGCISDDARKSLLSSNWFDHPWNEIFHLGKCCLLCQLDWQIHTLAVDEDRHWGLPEGSIVKRRNAEHRARRAKDIDELDLSEIVSRKLDRGK